MPPASSSSTLTSGFSASRRATTDPDEPDPQTMKSYFGFLRTKLPLIQANAFDEIERTRILVIGLPWVLHWIYQVELISCSILVWFFWSSVFVPTNAHWIKILYHGVLQMGADVEAGRNFGRSKIRPKLG